MTPITIYDIAKEAGVSSATVSRVLNNTAPVKASTRAKINAIIEKHQFQPNALARSLLKRETGTIAIIMPDITNPFFPEVFRGAENEARKKGHTFFLCNSAGDYSRESEYLSVLREKRVDGIIFLGGRINLAQCPPELAQEMIELSRHVPIVLVNGNIPKSGLPRVFTDEAKGAELATQHLIDLGHRNVAFLGGLEPFSTTTAKVKGFRATLRRNGIPYRPNSVLYGGFSITDGKTLMSRLLGMEDRPSAVFCVNDFTAIGAIKAAMEHGLRIPEDISIVGFDDTLLANAVVPELTTVTQNANELGALSVELLHRLITKDKARKPIALEPRLIVRKSTGPANRSEG
ncbi:LacI family DNA-binding transcriptional regulator [Cohnella thermotolerans]|uniref:LacI family DNA-binding transcriptional regulator n=1 Tax=Cohnella thermotolerans TaxID=329858 RepID=UPI000428CA4F|nr:LacI family DNA-binding transcriptional regulator [Cohnella thermotolerans]